MAKETGLPLMAADNFSVEVTAYGSEVLKHTLQLALAHHTLVEAYSEIEIRGRKTLVLHWSYHKDRKEQNKCPYPFRIEQLLPLIMGWLENQDYGEQPDLDGSCSKGWHLFTEIPYEEKRKQALPSWGISFAIQPEWAEHHK